MKRLILCVALLVPASLASAEAPMQISFPNGRGPDDPHVNGVRISLFYGENESMRGFDLGLLSLSQTRKMNGFALTAGVNRVSGDMSGAAISLVNIHDGRDKGLNAAFINQLGDPDGAVNIGFVQIADGETMLDIGGINVSDRSLVQLGFVNITKRITGFQFGFLNVAENGFLPVFPIFNFPGREPERSPDPDPDPEPYSDFESGF